MAKKKRTAAARTTISVPHDLKRQMDKLSDEVNWSSIAADAFAQEVSMRTGKPLNGVSQRRLPKHPKDRISELVKSWNRRQKKPWHGRGGPVQLRLEWETDEEPHVFTGALWPETSKQDRSDAPWEVHVQPLPCELGGQPVPGGVSHCIFSQVFEIDELDRLLLPVQDVKWLHSVLKAVEPGFSLVLRPHLDPEGIVCVGVESNVVTDGMTLNQFDDLIGQINMSFERAQSVLLNAGFRDEYPEADAWEQDLKWAEMFPE